jgi:chromosome segregation ATPase
MKELEAPDKEISKKKKKKRWKLVMTKVSDLDKQLAKLSKEIAAKNAKTEALAKEMDETSEQVESISRDMVANQLVSESLTKSVESNNVKIQSLVDEMALFRAEIEKEMKNSDPKNNGYGSLGENITLVNQKLDSFKNELSRVNESIFLLRSNEKDAAEKLEQHDEGLVDARAKIESLTNDSIPRLSRQLESYEKEFQSLGRKISSLSDHEAIQASTSANNGDATNGFSDQLAVISQRLEVLEKSLAENSAKLGELQSGISTLGKRETAVVQDSSLLAIDMLDEF